MGLTRIAILRPLFIAMVVLGLVVVGAVSYTRLGVDLLPNVDVPVTSVVTVYPGASPETVEQLVTKPIEDAVAGLNGIDYIQSYSSEGSSMVVIVFKQGVNADTASIDIERKVNSMRGSLPAQALSPSVVKADINAMPVMDLAVTGTASTATISDLANNVIAPELSTVAGVSSVNLVGGLTREIDVRVDQDRLRAYGLSILQVNSALAAENVDIPSGTVTQGSTDYQVRLNALVSDPQNFQNLVISNGPNGPVYLRDVATVVDSFKKQSQVNLVNGQPSVGLTISKQADANSLATSQGIKAQLKAMQSQLPANVQVQVITDTSDYTRQSLDGVQNTLVEAIILTGIVLLLFLHTWRSTLIVLLAIPTSLIATFTVMFVLGFTLNLMSMMALSLSVGILVDDSIVVLENIYRHFELGSTPFTAALEGRSEIGLAAIAITLVDVVVYAPVAFVSGFVGQFFKEFGLTIVAATLLSLFISFTLTPMLASRWLRRDDPTSRAPLAIFGRFWEAGFHRLQEGYRYLLAWALRFRWVVVAIGVASFAAGIGLAVSGVVGSEFIPSSDQGQFTVQVTMPAGMTLAATEDAVKQLDAKVRQIPEVKETFTSIGGSGGEGFGGGNAVGGSSIQVQLVDLKNRSRSVDQVAAEVRTFGGVIPGAKLTVQLPSSGGGSAQPIQVQIQGNDPAYLQQLSTQVEDIVRHTPGTADVTNSFALGQPEIDVQVDRARAADFGLPASQIGAAVGTAIDGQVATQLQPQGQKAIDVRVQANATNVQSVADVSNIPLVTPSGVVVSLGQVATISQANGPTQIQRKDRQQIITIGANLTDRPLGAVSQDLQEKFNALPVRPGTAISMGGGVQQQADAFLQLVEALGLSILLMYMLMVALYESLLYPFVIMLSVPLAMVGALGGLWLTGNTLNMMSGIGIIMLCGIVAKNAILLVDYTNTLRKRGVPRNAALQEAGPARLRPILMTTAAMVFAMLPSALKIGDGAELRAPMAVVVIGGLLTSTLLTLVFIPAVYTIVDDLQGLVRRIVGGGPEGPGTARFEIEPEPALTH